MSESGIAIDGSELAAVSMDGVGIVDDGELVRANDALADVHGYDSAADLVGRAWEALYVPEDADRTSDELLARVRDEGEWRGSALGRRQDGSDVPVELSLRATDGSVICVVSETTGPGGRPIDGGSRRESDVPGPIDLLEQLVDAIDDVVYVVDAEDEVVYWDRRLGERPGTNVVDLPDRTREVSKEGERIPYELGGATYTGEVAGERYRVGIARDLTERIEREERLERYETIVETVDGGVYVLDGDRRVEMGNERLLDMLAEFGYPRDEIQGLHAHDLLVDEEECASFEAEIERAIERDSHTGSFEVSARTPDGDELAFESRFRLYPEPNGEYRGCIGILRDITERKERERELREANQFNEELVEYAPFSIVRIDEDFRITYINPRTEEVTGLPADMESQAMGMDIRELPSVAETGEAHRFTPLENGETIEFEFPFESLYGREVYFTGRGVPLIRDGEFDGAVLMAVDISERHQQEKDLERQRDELDTLNQINELLLAVARDLFESPMQGDIEQTVCDRLAASDLYQFAWIGKPEVGEDRLVPDVVAGIDEEHVESLALTTDEGDTDSGPVGRAFRTGTVQVSQDLQTDPSFEQSLEASTARDSRSVAAVPLAYAGTTYGVLTVYTARPLAFTQREQRGFEMLGEATGYAINASRTRQLLFAEQVAELEFRISDASEFVLDASVRLDCSLALEGYISTGDGSWLMYLSLPEEDADPGRFVDLARDDPAVDAVRTAGNGAERVVAVTARSSLLDEIAALGGKVTSGFVDAGHWTVVVEVPQSTTVGEFVEQIRSTFPGVTLLAKRDGERPAERSAWLSGDGPVDLTDRQRQALEAAYFAGYFEWPRESSAEDVADLLNISRPTLQAHLRKAQQELLGAFVD